jgi:hypothetical protein
MHPVWVIRASRMAFALRSNRESTPNVRHKRPSPPLFFLSLFYPLLSTLNPSIRNPSSATSYDPTQPSLHEAFFSNLVAHLEEPARLATVPATLSISRLCRKPSVLVQASYSSFHTRRAWLIQGVLDFYLQSNATGTTLHAGRLFHFCCLGDAPSFHVGLAWSTV